MSEKGHESSGRDRKGGEEDAPPEIGQNQDGLKREFGGNEPRSGTAWTDPPSSGDVARFD